MILDNAMIRLTPQHRFHVSNRAAMLAALLLVITSFASFSSGSSHDQKYVENAQAASTQTSEKVANQTSNKRKLNLSLLLIGRG
jgi:hypothetical protein